MAAFSYGWLTTEGASGYPQKPPTAVNGTVNHRWPFPNFRMAVGGNNDEKIINIHQLVNGTVNGTFPTGWLIFTMMNPGLPSKKPSEHIGTSWEIVYLCIPTVYQPAPFSPDVIKRTWHATSGPFHSTGTVVTGFTVGVSKISKCWRCWFCWRSKKIRVKCSIVFLDHVHVEQVSPIFPNCDERGPIFSRFYSFFSHLPLQFFSGRMLSDVMKVSMTKMDGSLAV